MMTDSPDTKNNSNDDMETENGPDPHSPDVTAPEPPAAQPSAEVAAEGPVADVEEKAAPDQRQTDEGLYEEPVPLTRRDMAGVILSLVALTVIGLGGYIWITPGLTLGDVLKKGGGDMHAGHDHGAMLADSSDEHAGHGPTMEMAAAASVHVKCAYCGMFADKSMAQVKATWADGGVDHFDSWFCLFNHAEDEGLKPADLQVVSLNGTLEDPEWLDAGDAWFLYRMDESVEGSMPPFVGAWSDRENAAASMTEMGGELVDFNGLQAAFGFGEVS